ncbi:sensor histidine kinase [Limibacillus halophilus]|uniref:histidine kinase n=1 Tax=Limibacillus halophilus TaxID=1579333 RepID=A0A839SXV0_9PROT|nr:HAMP domain-containing sensor histidine kinase [Limibacillus halophilus]MBB3066500.1 signal transduction histidine kinase [Limibacillus halophilus]
MTKQALLSALPLPKVTYTLVAIIIVVCISLGAWISVGITSAQRSLNQAPHERIDYHLFQLEIELYRLVGAIDSTIRQIEKGRLVEGGAGSMLYQRYAIFWSRIDIFNEGQPAAMIGQIESGNDLVSGLEALLLSNERVAISKNPKIAELQPLRAQLEPWGLKVRNVALGGLFLESQVMTSLYSGLKRKFQYILGLGFVLFGAIATLIVFVISSSRAREQARKKIESQQNAIISMSSGTAHEFNNLLMAIRSTVEMARLETLDGNREQALQDLEAIHEESRRGVDLTQRLLRFIGHAPTDVRSLPAKELFEACTAAAETIIKRNSFDAKPTGSDLRLRVDVSGLTTAVSYLISNAEDATNNGNITLAGSSISLRRTAAKSLGLTEANYFVLSVSDNGTGMTPEVLAHCRESFYTTKAAGRGAGLGLGIVSRIAEANNGAITIESKSGRGTRASIYLPVSN